MTRNQIIRALHTHRHELVEQFGVASLKLFGSAARDELSANSDVDLLVEFCEPTTFDRFMDLKLYLQQLLGRSVDLVTTAGLRPGLRPTIEREAVRVA